MKEARLQEPGRVAATPIHVPAPAWPIARSLTGAVTSGSNAVTPGRRVGFGML
ncbi:hypothetical protein EV670_2341 [Rivibacter subsaxonicus]|uniref:Uncharacterized protein n=1 Tax=Rivibacter subsaxonicus TaxID=457575 RepID=A0A4Q7VNJ5_9BURK|nr:hypothetical protein EV670_2341 [Rivibacter subsaxonicus]